MQCAGCKKDISGPALKALGKSWHPPCLACAHCGKTLATETQFTQHEGKLYHPSCYNQVLALKCDLCKKPLEGKYVKDAWGYALHPHHFKEVPRCFSCQRLAHNAISGQPMAYKDGHVVCGICRKTAVIAQASAEQAFEEARQWFQSVLPFAVNPNIPVRTVDRKEIQKHTKRGRAQTAGVTRTLLRKVGEQEDRKVEVILILAGLPRLHFLSVAVHELMHAWLFLNGISPLPARTEEGLCVLMEALFLSGFKSEEARFYRKAIRENKDPIYGAGYRQAHDAYKKQGLAKLLRQVARKKKLPGGLFSFF